MGNPLNFRLSGGEEADCAWAIPTLTDLEFGTLLGDKGYDTNEIVDFLEQRGSKTCIPPKINRKVQREYDAYLYKERNLVERFFNKLKHYRRLSTRYDKTAIAYLGFVYLAASLFWLN